MKFILASILALAFCVSALAQTVGIKLGFNAQSSAVPSSWSGSLYYDVRAKHGSAVAFNRLGGLHDMKGRDIGLEADALLGVSDQKGTPATFGGALIWHKDVLKELKIVLGLGGAMTAGKWGGGPVIGLSYAFGG